MEENIEKTKYLILGRPIWLEQFRDRDDPDDVMKTSLIIDYNKLWRFISFRIL